MLLLLELGNFISLQRLTTTDRLNDSNLRETLKAKHLCVRVQSYANKHTHKRAIHIDALNSSGHQLSTHTVQYHVDTLLC